MRISIPTTYEVNNVEEAKKIKSFFVSNPDIAIPGLMINRIVNEYERDPIGSRQMVNEISNSPTKAIKHSNKILKILTGMDLSISDLITGSWKNKVK